ncbi:response regulator transcription factor [Clostridium oryzae]|uniref:Stage 0 sporulation protein A homolog n=1 Tax=Clostridium oryzae TaxID=1450648 RepID=A0A1V4IR20_9CLOT|nr:response regulator transcription factor [Clostridium oryzae]OPJ62260.1 transcriptional regulatory protein DegU [Clostridium oryzae]
MEKIKVLIADDQTLMRDGLKTILELEDNIDVIGLAANGEEVLSICKMRVPDVVLMDIRMPKMDGVECTKKLKKLNAEIKVLILTTFDDIEYIVQALNYGAAGYILKDIEGDELIKTINAVSKGNLMLPVNIAQKLASQISTGTAASEEKKKFTDFTDREIDIAKMLAEGFNNRQISSYLYISEGTVKNYISNIYAKLGTSDRTAAAIAIKKLMDK